MPLIRSGAIVAALACLAAFAACRRSPGAAESEPSLPQMTGAASRIHFKNAQEAERALLPSYVRTIPLSTFRGAQGLKVGVKIAATTASGKKFIGTVVAIGKDEVTVSVETP